jgi:HEAT repeat protein
MRDYDIVSIVKRTRGLDEDARTIVQDRIDLLRAAGVKLYSELLMLFQDPLHPVEQRLAASVVLARVGDRKVVPIMTRTLKDAPIQLRRSILSDLPLLADRRAIRPMIEALKTDTDKEVRTIAVSSIVSLALILKFIHNPANSRKYLDENRVVGTLTRILRDHLEDPGLRGVIAKDLGHLDNPGVIEPLRAALDDPSAEVRYWAAYALGYQRDQQALPALEQLAASDSALVRNLGSVSASAQRAVEVIRQRPDATQVSQDSLSELLTIVRDWQLPLAVRKAAFHMLGKQQKEQAIPVLSAILLDREEEAVLRRAAAIALGAMANQRSIRPLTQLLVDSEEELGLRATVAKALADVGDNSAEDAMIAALRDPAVPVRYWAVYALAQWGTSNALPQLEYLAANDQSLLEGEGPISRAATAAIRLIRARLERSHPGEEEPQPRLAQ